MPLKSGMLSLLVLGNFSRRWATRPNMKQLQHQAPICMAVRFAREGSSTGMLTQDLKSLAPQTWSQRPLSHSCSMPTMWACTGEAVVVDFVLDGAVSTTKSGDGNGTRNRCGPTMVSRAQVLSEVQLGKRCLARL